jgi:cardiolipin synthase
MRNFVQRWAAGFSARTLSETRLLAMAGPPARIGLATQVEPAASFSDGDSVINIPNILSLARLLSVPVAIMLMLNGEFGVCFWLFVAAGVTDAVDGWIAKTFDARTALGAYLDPLADKALVVSTYLMLGWLGHIPGWLVVLVVFRDVLIIGGAMVAYFMLGDFNARPLAISKVNTSVQIALVGAVLARLGTGFGHPGLDWALVLVAAATTLLSGGAYLWQWGRRLAREDGSR